MKLKDLFYHYYKDYLADLVKELQVRDNWGNARETINYAQYMQDLINAEHIMAKMEKTIGRELNDCECVKVLVGLKKKRLEKSYTDISNSFFNYIHEQKPMAVEDQVRYEKRLYLQREWEGFNMGFLKEMKKIEDEFLRG